MKLRSGDPWMTAREYAHSLKALTVNLLVREIDAATRFQQRVLGARIVYSDPDIAVVAAYGAGWMFHADHTYQGHPLAALVPQAPLRGAGIELRVHGCDPDAATAAARRFGYRILAEPTNAGHGLREAFLCDPDGYVWVPDTPVRA
jgi:catechol 2,3-dioxygenase-like lactoylglutathione lyase family enzyme